jgi:regulator of RNase E activity RraB
MTTAPQIVFDEWNAYPAERDGVTMFVSFDEAVAREEPPANLQLCARVMIPIHSPNNAGGPVSPESEVLWSMEDELVSLLQDHHVHCRLVGRLTYGGLREIVFQLHDWDSFRPPVGLWIMRHEEYQIDVSEHEGWDFFDDFIRPRIEDQLFMADRSVVDSLVRNGSDPEKEHSLEYVFMGAPDALKHVAQALRQRGYTEVGELDFSSGQIVLAKRLILDLPLIVDESLANYRLAEGAGIEFNGWGALVVG